MTQATIAVDAPIEVDVVAGEKYFFCTCGLSKTQPSCDGSHKGTGLKSLHYTADKTGKVWLCRKTYSPAGA